MDEIRRLRKLYELKNVDRKIPLDGRHESSAEHTYSCLVLAQYFLPKIRQKLDEPKVMRMILYHDVVEIESGDTYFLDDKGDKEEKAFPVLLQKIPVEMKDDVDALWNQYEAGKSPEARFCKAIDKLDPAIQIAFSKDIWRNKRLSEKIVRQAKDDYFKEFPELSCIWEKIVDYAKKNGYFID
ncbi:HD domain-containing protein [Candidatus Woesearchaeota archaeon]|nr:HD domain-containing protein [Candidatus Woesearchaeota archaeon]